MNVQAAEKMSGPMPKPVILDKSHLDAIFALHQDSIGVEACPDHVKPEERSFFESILDGRGLIIGIFDDQLIAYGVLQTIHAAEENTHKVLSLAPEVKIARLAGAAVADAWRGQDLHSTLIHARVQAAEENTLLFSTAAPANYASWSNLLSQCFPIHAIVSKFGGFTRYLMVHDQQAFNTASTFAVDPLDVPRQKALLHNGYRGYSVVTLASGERAILYAKSSLQLSR
jgi:hypothetical protein